MLDRYQIKGRGWAVTLVATGVVGDRVWSAGESWVIQGVEMAGRTPVGYLLGATAPEVGACVSFDPDLRLQLAQAHARIAELESDRARLDTLLASAYRNA